MCFMFGCCGPPPFATIKAYDNTSPFALDWFDDRDGGDGGIRETAIIDWSDESGYTIGVLSVGDGAEVTGSTNETALVERDADDGDRQTESSSSPRVAQVGFGGQSTLLKSTPVSGPSGGAWHWTAGVSGTTINRLQFFDLDLVQLCDINAIAILGSVAASVGLADSLNVIAGQSIETPSGTSPVARRWNESGTVVGTLTASGLTVTGGRTRSRAVGLITRPDTVNEFLVYGDERTGAGTYYRQLWLCDKTTMVQTAVGTPVLTSGTTERYLRTSSSLNFSLYEAGKASRITSTHAILHLADGDVIGGATSDRNATIVCVVLSNGFGVPEEDWTLNDKSRSFVAMDASRVYTVNTTGELSAVTLSTGVEAWTLDLSAANKLGTGTGQVYGAVLSSGNIAVWRNHGATIVTTAGVEVATVDVGPCYGIVEKENRWIIVGGKRTTES